MIVVVVYKTVLGTEVADSGVTVTTTVSETWFVIVVVDKTVLAAAVTAESELATAEVTKAASELTAATEDAAAEDDLDLQGFLVEVDKAVGLAKPDEAPVPDG